MGWIRPRRPPGRCGNQTARELEKLNKGGTVILLGSTTDNRALVRVGHANPAAPKPVGTSGGKQTATL